jgi:hypothetical protein
MKSATLALFLAVLSPLVLSPSAQADCVGELGRIKIDGRKISERFQIEKRELKSLPKDANQVLAFKFTGKPLPGPQEEALYHKTLYFYDSLLAKNRCPASTARVFFVFPKGTVTISTRDLASIRPHKSRPKWQADVNVRSQVTHGKS